MSASRRQFLSRTAAFTAATLASRLGPLAAAGLAGGAHAQAAPDYKALVCVFLYGGVDGNSLVVPLDAAGYAQYAAARPASSGIDLAQSQLLPIQPGNAAAAYGLHPALAPLQPLFARQRMAIVANVGPLNEPTDRASLASKRPDNLFSHSDQQNQWQSSVSAGPSRTGWGGRIADALAATSPAFPVVTSIAGASLFTAGDASSPLALPPTGGLALQGFNGGGAANARLAALRAIAAADDDNAYVKAAGDVTARAMALSGVVNPILSAASPVLQPLFAGQASGIAQQLLQVAKLIEARGQTGARRQVFFVSQGGYDTHSNQPAVLDTLLGQLAPALGAFDDAMAALGVAGQVTTFTLSDFGRTLQPNSAQGTDHAWGNHHFVLGGAVRGGQLYGRFPTLARAGPDDADTSGRWIPTTSVEQYGATLARWFGVGDAAMASVFPNLARFSTANLGFLA